MKNYAIILLSYKDQLYNYFDNYKIQICKDEGIYIKNILNASKENLNENELNYEYSIDVFCLLPKFLWGYNHLKNELDKYDYIIRTNSSTFLNFPILEKHIEKLPKTQCYAGCIAYNKFISGTCIIMTKDVIEKIIQSPYKDDYKKRNEHVLDDVLIGKIMAHNNINMINIPMHQFADLYDVPNDENIINALNTSPIIRVRNNSNRNKIDKYVWSKLTEHYYKKKVTNE